MCLHHLQDKFKFPMLSTNLNQNAINLTLNNWFLIFYSLGYFSSVPMNPPPCFKTVYCSIIQHWNWLHCCFQMTRKKVIYFSWNKHFHLKMLFFHHMLAKLKLKIYKLKLSCATTCKHTCICIHYIYTFFSDVKYQHALHWKTKL